MTKNAYKCDRCGEYFDNLCYQSTKIGKDSESHYFYLVERVRSISEIANREVILCDDCAKDLVRFINMWME